MSSCELHIGTNSDLPEDNGLQNDHRVWDNIGTVRETAYWMQQITKEVATRELNIPLHAGAYRNKETGFDLPAHLKPPEVK